MKKIFKSKVFWIIFIIVIVAGGIIYSNLNKTDTEEIVTSFAEKGLLVQTVSATGKVESATETNLNFTNSGNLAKLYLKVGDKVKKGQILAELQSGQAASQVANAQAGVSQAEADLATIIAGSTAEEIAVASAKVSQAQADLAAKQDTLSHAISERDQNIISLKEQAVNEANESIFVAKESLEDIDDFINDNSYTIQFSNHPVTHTKAKASYNSGIAELHILEDIIDNYSMDSTVDELVFLLTETDEVLTKASIALFDTFDLLSNILPSGSLTQANIDTFKTNIAADQTSVSANISSVQSIKSDLQTGVLEYDNNVEIAQAEIQKAEAALAVAQAELELKQAGPTDYNVDLYEAKLRQAQASLQKAVADLVDYTIKSPLEGIVTKINYEIGEYISSNEPVLTIIGESNFEIEVDVPESDIAKVKAGDAAEITLDAFGEEKIFVGHITLVDPAETIINDVVYYKVKVIFDEISDEVKSGMTANLSVTTAEREDAIYIPARAVIEAYGRRFVRTMENGQMIEKDVATGLRGDDGLIEIINGLNKGDEVVTYIKSSK